jgi:hypothetical protein
MKVKVSIKKEYYGTEYVSELQYPSIATAVAPLKELYADPQCRRAEIAFSSHEMTHVLNRVSVASGGGSFNTILPLLEVLVALEREVDRKEYR